MAQIAAPISPHAISQWPDWHLGTADTAVAAVDTAAAAAEDVCADYFSVRPSQAFGLRSDVAELQRLKDEGSEEDEPRIDMPKLDAEEDEEGGRQWINYNQHVLMEYGSRLDTVEMRSLRYHDVSEHNNPAYSNWRRSRYNQLKRTKAAKAKEHAEENGVWNYDELSDFVKQNCTFARLI